MGGEVLIALFDSGVGGLTVLQPLRRRLPLRDYMYLCDQAHFPYGDRPPGDVRRDVARFAEIAREAGAEAFVLACNTATAIALDQARAVFGPHTYGVIGAAGDAGRRASAVRRVGVLATTNTCESHAYRAAIGAGVAVDEVACPELIALAERGGVTDEMIDDAARAPLAELRAAGVDVVILGCTHLPHFEQRLRHLTTEFAQLIDPGEQVAALIASEIAPRDEHAMLQCRTTGDPALLRRRCREVIPGAKGATFTRMEPDAAGAQRFR